jgi:superfamily I DNA and/or RNA helicase
MARRRVVLVGDHRQLPQLLDPEVIARVIEARDGEEQRDASAEILERSLFERLFTALDRPGVVTRTVTLDRQYRMHPVIGSLINEFFYEPHGEPISNGVTADDRDPTWTGSPHPLQWIDVPGSAGHSERVPSGSWVRECEARRAADLLIDLLERDPIRTVGVISFYRGQVAAIWRVLVERDMAGETDDGWFEVRSSWLDAFGEAGTPRFLIGTVDSFQGREFDAVILSTVRSGGGFGFLQVENRLCVAMSRARHALIPVGDQQHFRTEDARQRVPALHAVASRAEVRP